MKQQLTNYLRAGFAGLFAHGPENQRIEGEVAAAAKEAGFEFYSWSLTKGLFHIKPAKGKKPAEATAIEMDGDMPPHCAVLVAFDKLAAEARKSGSPTKAVFLLHDFHQHLAQPDPVLFRMIKDSLLNGKMCSHSLVIQGVTLNLPPELEKEITVMEFKLPERPQLLVIAENIAKSSGLTLNGGTDALLDAASGLTCQEAEDAMALAVVETKDLTPSVVARVKAETIRKNGILEIVESKTTLDDIGGLEHLKAHLFGIRKSFTKAAKDYGLPSPRPVLAVGQAGVGKSLCATACGNIFGVPLLRLEAGRLFGSLVGESERNWRTAFNTAKAVAPCCVHVDEVDGLFSGAESSGRSDGGTTSRVIKAILQDMQFNSEGIFFVFTANDIDNLPDPLVDRCDVWSVDLPTHAEREAVWKIHIAKRGRDPQKFNLRTLASASEGFSGRQIEQAWIAAMTWAFNQDVREPTEADCCQVLERMVPTSKTMAEAIERRRKRLQNKAQPASVAERLEVVHTGRKIA